MLETSVAIKGPMEYHENPSDLQQSHPDVYSQAYEASSGPVPSKWSVQQRCVVTYVSPCRNTKAGCEDTKASKIKGCMHQLMSQVSQAHGF